MEQVDTAWVLILLPVHFLENQSDMQQTTVKSQPINQLV